MNVGAVAVLLLASPVLLFRRPGLEFYHWYDVFVVFLVWAIVLEPARRSVLFV